MRGTIKIGGREFRTWSAAAGAHNILPATFAARVYARGWDRLRAATTPPREKKIFLLDGIDATLSEHAARLGMTEGGVRHRLRKEEPAAAAAAAAAGNLESGASQDARREGSFEEVKRMAASLLGVPPEQIMITVTI